MPSPDIEAFFDEPTFTVSYLVGDPESRRAVVIDAVLDYDHKAGLVDTVSVEAILERAAGKGFTIEWALETHAHSDHITAAPFIKERTGARIGIGEHIKDEQRIFQPLFNATDLKTDGSYFDRLFTDGEHFAVGGLDFEVIDTPGHTAADISYRLGDVVFVGDTIFMPDFGTARADFTGGDARKLYRSIHRLLSLPDETRLFTCHDYKAPSRDVFAWESTVRAQRETNVHVGGGRSEDDFVKLREARDATLEAPTLQLPALQVNIRGGHFPPAASNGVHYLAIPVKPKRKGQILPT
jgi:glyoxylase-like metal-dependent hydrolase (beta-lactamase superfamily II)